MLTAAREFMVRSYTQFSGEGLHLTDHRLNMDSAVRRELRLLTKRERHKAGQEHFIFVWGSVRSQGLPIWSPEPMGSAVDRHHQRSWQIKNNQGLPNLAFLPIRSTATWGRAERCEAHQAHPAFVGLLLDLLDLSARRSFSQFTILQLSLW